jgi:hypothetical protein
MENFQLVGGNETRLANRLIFDSFFLLLLKSLFLENVKVDYFLILRNKKKIFLKQIDPIILL